MLEYNPDFLVKINLEAFGIAPLWDFYVYRDELNHPEISGNKLRKLHGNIIHAKKKGYETLITIGGNRSNHLYAAAHIPEHYGLNVVAIVKGHEPPHNGHTLSTLRTKNIPIHFYPKAEIKEHLPQIVADLKTQYPNALFIPEGGTNEFSSVGFEPLMTNFPDADWICVPSGTGGTALGIRKFLNPKANVRAYAALNDTSLEKMLDERGISLTFDYTFGGYAKWTNALDDLIQKFENQTNIRLDSLYTGKMIWGILQDMKSGFFLEKSVVIAWHTGGLQGKF